MSSRKKISFKTKLCAALMLAYNFDYKHAKELTEDQFLSLFQFDHNMLHESGHEHVDKFWNLTPMWISAHREKTRRDAVIIAKGRRLRRKLPNKTMIAALDELDAAADAPALRTGPDESGDAVHGAHDTAAHRPARLRREGHHLIISPEARQELRDGNPAVLGEVFREGVYQGKQEANAAWTQEANRPGGALRWRKLRSRGFDKTLRRKMSGKVVKR